MPTSKNTYRLLMAASALVALSACGQAGTDAGNSISSALTSTSGAKAEQAKLDTYVEGYNKLIGTFGLPETAETYEKQEVAGQSATDTITISTGWIDQAIAKFKEARKMPGGPADLDKAADTMIAALDKVMARLEPLNTYYQSKAYKEDNLARGKREDGPMLAEFKAALDSSEAFNVVLKRERNARTSVEIAEMKKQGNMLGYTTKLALQKSEQLVDLFNTPEDIKNPALIAKGDALVAEIEKALAEQRAAYATAKAAAKSPIEAPDISFTSVDRGLTSMVGDYREMKQSRDVRAAKQLVDSYNDAVESANRIG